jgi:hypothetical protein
MLRSLMAAFPADEGPEVNQVELHTLTSRSPSWPPSAASTASL